jgi:hypothetical protein
VVTNELINVSIYLSMKHSLQLACAVSVHFVLFLHINYVLQVLRHVQFLTVVKLFNNFEAVQQTLVVLLLVQPLTDPNCIVYIYKSRISLTFV